MKRNNFAGLTLVEVLIAVVLLAVGILATVAFQASTLRTNRDAQVINQLTRLATTEMELRRQTLVSQPGTTNCITEVPDGFNQESCEVYILPCGVILKANNSEFLCGEGLPFATYRIVVAAEAEGQSVLLQSLFGGWYVSGSLGAQ